MLRLRFWAITIEAVEGGTMPGQTRQICAINGEFCFFGVSFMTAATPATFTERIALRLANAPRELKLFATASLVMGMAYSMMDATFNNFLNERYALSGFQRSFLEFPRELPGLLTVFVTALLWFLCTRRLGVVALVMGVAGTLLIGFAAPVYGVMVAWLFIYSLGQHLF